MRGCEILSGCAAACSGRWHAPNAAGARHCAAHLNGAKGPCPRRAGAPKGRRLGIAGAGPHCCNRSQQEGMRPCLLHVWGMLGLGEAWRCNAAAGLGPVGKGPINTPARPCGGLNRLLAMSQQPRHTRSGLHAWDLLPNQPQHAAARSAQRVLTLLRFQLSTATAATRAQRLQHPAPRHCAGGVAGGLPQFVWARLENENS